MVTARTDIRPVAYMRIDMRANMVNIEGARAVGTGKDLFADLEVEEVLRPVGKQQRAVAAAPREFVVSVHYRALCYYGSLLLLAPIGVLPQWV